MDVRDKRRVVRVACRVSRVGSGGRPLPVLGILLLLLASLTMTATVFTVARFVPVDKRKAHNNVLGFAYAEIGVIYAVVLAMVVVGVWDTRAQAYENTYTETYALLQITWYSRSLPQPDRARLGDLTARYTNTVLHDEGSLLSEQRASPAACKLFTGIRELINTREPATGADQARYEGALDAVALLVGALVTIGFSQLFGMDSVRAHAGVVFSLTVTVGVMLLIVYEFDYPFSGPLRVSPTAFQLALDRIRPLT